MIIAVDYDGTIVSQDRAYDDLDSPTEFMPGAKEALLALKEAGHVLILFSARCNPWLLRDPELDPMVLAGLRKARKRDLTVNIARYHQMMNFIREELPDVFDLVWDGNAGKPSADLFIDDRGLQFGSRTGWTWSEIVKTYGDA